jgi:hypothetical protein
MSWKIFTPENYKYKLRKTSLEKEEPGRESRTISETLSSEGIAHELRKDKAQNMPQVQMAQNAMVGRDAFVQAALPVRFAVPETGVRLAFAKNIVQPDEGNFITLGYRKIPRAVSTARRVLRTMVLLAVLVLIVWYWRRRSRRKKELEAYKPKGVTP